MSTALDIITRAFRTTGIVSSTDPLPADLSADGLIILNGMLNAWIVDQLYIFDSAIASYALTSGTQSYSIGSTAASPFNVARPTKINNANLVVTSVTPNTRIPLQLIDDDEWMAIPVRNTTASYPKKLYYARSFPLGVLNFWPKPSGGLSVELETWSQITEFAALATTFSLPPGYFEAVVYSLAKRLCTPEFGRGPDPAIDALAESALVKIQSMNMNPPPKMAQDPGLGGAVKPRGNIYNPLQWYR